MYMCPVYAMPPVARRGCQIPLELELEMVLRCNVGAETKPGSSLRVPSASNHWAVLQVLRSYSFYEWKMAGVYLKYFTSRVGDAAQWESTCRMCPRSWVQSPVLQKEANPEKLPPHPFPNNSKATHDGHREGECFYSVCCVELSNMV